MKEYTTDHTRKCVQACAGLPDGALDGGWTAAEMSAYAKRLEDTLLEVARRCEGLKRPCSEDPESAQAVRNSEYMSIAYIARATLRHND